MCVPAPHGPRRARPSAWALKPRGVLRGQPAGGAAFFRKPCFGRPPKSPSSRCPWGRLLAVPAGALLCFMPSGLLAAVEGARGGSSRGLCLGSGMNRTMCFYPWVCPAWANSKISLHAWSARRLSGGRAEVRGGGPSRERGCEGES